MNLPEYDEIKKRFQIANKSIDHGWSYLLLDDKWEDREFKEMVARTRDHYREDRPKLGKGNRDFTFAFATLNGKGTQTLPALRSTRSKSCVCGQPHTYNRCWYLNPRARRPKGWQERPEVRARVNEALDDKRVQHEVQKSIPQLQSTNARQHDSDDIMDMGLSVFDLENSNRVLNDETNDKVKTLASLSESMSQASLQQTICLAAG